MGGSLGRPAKISIVAAASLVLSALSVLLGVVEIPRFSPIDFLASHLALLPEDASGYIEKGLPPLTAGEFEFEHRSSPNLLESFLGLRNDDKRSDLADELLSELEEKERSSSLRTRSLLLTLRGRHALQHGATNQAIETLEEACRLAPHDNPWAPYYLQQAYERWDAELRAKPLPWSLEDQEKLHDVGEKIDGLEAELERRRISQQQLGADGDVHFVALDDLAGDGLPTTLAGRVASVSVWFANEVAEVRQAAVHLHFDVEVNNLGPGKVGDPVIAADTVTGTGLDEALLLHFTAHDVPADFLDDGWGYTVGHVAQRVVAARQREVRMHSGVYHLAAGKLEDPLIAASRTVGNLDATMDANIGNRTAGRTMLHFATHALLKTLLVDGAGTFARGHDRLEPVVLPLLGGEATPVAAWLTNLYGGSREVGSSSIGVDAGLSPDANTGLDFKINNVGLLFNGETPGASARMVSVGIDAYDAGGSPLPSLRHASQDAERVASALRRLGYVSSVLHNGDATRGGILEALALEALRSRPGDRFVFFFSGHGFTDRDGNRVLVTGGGTEVVTLSEIAAILAYHQGEAVVIADACFDRRDLALGSAASYPQKAGNLEADDENANGHGTRFNNIDITARDGVHFILAGSPGEVAVESQRLGSGVFTYALVDYLAGLDAGQALDWDDLIVHTAAETARLAKSLHGVAQHPVLLAGSDPN